MILQNFFVSMARRLPSTRQHRLLPLMLMCRHLHRQPAAAFYPIFSIRLRWALFDTSNSPNFAPDPRWDWKSVQDSRHRMDFASESDPLPHSKWSRLVLDRPSDIAVIWRWWTVLQSSRWLSVNISAQRTCFAAVPDSRIYDSIETWWFSNCMWWFHRESSGMRAAVLYRW